MRSCNKSVKYRIFPPSFLPLYNYCENRLLGALYLWGHVTDRTLCFLSYSFKKISICLLTLVFITFIVYPYLNQMLLALILDSLSGGVVCSRRGLFSFFIRSNSSFVECLTSTSNRECQGNFFSFVRFSFQVVLMFKKSLLLCALHWWFLTMRIMHVAGWYKRGRRGTELSNKYDGNDSFSSSKLCAKGKISERHFPLPLTSRSFIFSIAMTETIYKPLLEPIPKVSERKEFWRN